MRLFEVANSSAQSRPTVYLDMDGVLADFFGQVADREGASHWRKARKIKDRIDQVAQEPGFFLDLKPLPNAARLVRGVVKLAGDYSILSSPMMSNPEQSTREKTQWLDHYLQKCPPQSVQFDQHKEKFARQADGTPNILIDDWVANIQLWVANGGIGILYTDENYDQVLKKLRRALLHGGPTAQTSVTEQDHDDPKPRLLTNRQVLDYIQDIHHDYHLEKPVLRHKTWVLRRIPISALQTPEFYDQDDPYRRVIDLDFDHISQIDRDDIDHRPVVSDADGWLLDGNHRATRARMLGMDSIMAIVPYNR
jgi:5'(3')-deoxyribonucleotidase